MQAKVGIHWFDQEDIHWSAYKQGNSILGSLISNRTVNEIMGFNKSFFSSAYTTLFPYMLLFVV